MSRSAKILHLALEKDPSTFNGSQEAPESKVRRAPKYGHPPLSTDIELESQTRDSNVITPLASPETSPPVAAGSFFASEDNLQSTENQSNSNIKNGTHVRRKLFFANSDENLSTDCSVKIPKIGEKKNFCIYCKKLVCKIARHLESVHKCEEDVKKFIILPKGCTERKQIINTIRRSGDFLFNTDPDYNEKGKVIVCRKPRSQSSTANYKPCSNCKGFFSQLSLRKHYKNCVENHVSGERTVLINSRKIHGLIHRKASEVLRNEIFPVIREDSVSKILRYDELATLYGNKMCLKYKSKHLHSMMRARLRLIGRFIIEIKKIKSDITDFASVFHPINYDFAIKAINNVAQLNESNGKYKSPATAFSLGTALKLNATILISECIKTSNKEKKKQASEFLALLTEDLGSSINKTVAENQLQHKRQKNIVLPTNDDIKLLNKYLATNRRKCYEYLTKKVSSEKWLELASLTLISIQVFNRRRPGELERAYISDYLNYQIVDEETDPEIFKNLSLDSQLAAKQYIRFQIRGKLARGVPVLVHTELRHYLDFLLKCRKHVNIPDENTYLFGIPGPNIYKHLDANKLMRQYSTACGARHPNVLRATQLRKHVATQSVLLNLQENEVHDLAEFMGHADKIHKDHYRLPIAARDIVQMSRLLELAQGKDDDCPAINKEDSINTNNETVDTSNPKITTDESPETNGEIQEVDTSDVPFTPEECFNTNGQIPEMDTFDSTNTTDLPKCPIRRKTWNTPERHKARIILSKYMNTNRLPSFRECEQYIMDNPCLQMRTPVQLKLWIYNQLRNSQRSTAAKKTTWNTPERHAIRKAFKENFKNKILPSKAECIQARETFKALRNRSAEQIKAQIFNEINRSKK